MARINLTDRRIAALKPDPSYAALLKEYGVTEVTGDGYSGSWVETAFQDAGIAYQRSELKRAPRYVHHLFFRSALGPLAFLYHEARGRAAQPQLGGCVLLLPRAPCVGAALVCLLCC